MTRCTKLSVPANFSAKLELAFFLKIFRRNVWRETTFHNVLHKAFKYPKHMTASR